MLVLEAFFIDCDVVSVQVINCKIPTAGLFRFEAESLWNVLRGRAVEETALYKIDSCESFRLHHLWVGY
jgi:hypothetical protein